MNNINLKQLSSYFFSKKSNSWFKLHQPIMAYVYRKNQKVNLLNQQVESIPFDKFIDNLSHQEIFSEKDNTFKVIHLFYEAGSNLQSINLDDEAILAIELLYTIKDKVLLDGETLKSQNVSLTLLQEPLKSDYEKKFNNIIENIKSGNFYQLNFTMRWRYQFLGGVKNLLKRFILANDKIASLAHFTIIPSMQKILISNTPECLFIAKKNGKKTIVDTYPIKGTATLSSGLTQAKKLLMNSRKDLAELDMITDLMRNDLNKIEVASAEVLRRRFFISVPNLLQQVSWIRGIYLKKIHLQEIIKAMFPGGSITGAPKIAAMKTIHNLEDTKRGFYCGSTLYLSKRSSCASINIRSATIDLATKSFEVAAGGGITLLSKMEDEWSEMLDKKNSFLKIWANR